MIRIYTSQSPLTRQPIYRFGPINLQITAVTAKKHQHCNLKIIKLTNTVSIHAPRLGKYKKTQGSRMEINQKIQLI